MLLDLLTMSVVLLLTNIMLSFVLLVTWRAHTNERALLVWTGANISMALFATCLIFIDKNPGSIWLLFTGLLTAAAHGFIWVGLHSFYRGKANWAGFILPIIALGVLNSLFFFVVPVTQVRVGASGFLSGLFILLAVNEIRLAQRHEPSTSSRILAGILMLHIAFIAYRFGFALLSDKGGTFTQGNTNLAGIAMVETLLFFIMSNVFFVILVTERLRDKLDKLATFDCLTSLFNRRAFEMQTDAILARARRCATPVSLLLLDIDRFKTVNDSYGHLSGDLVLVAIANYLKTALRAGDIAARYGGEEFIIMLPDTEVGKARLVAERIRSDIANLTVPTQKATLRITVSIGISSLQSHETLSAIIARADEALYAAKRNGRNRVVVDTINVQGNVQNNTTTPILEQLRA